MDAGIYFPLFLVLEHDDNPRKWNIYYLLADLQNSELFIPRKKLSNKAKRAGWQVFLYDFSKIINNSIVRLK